MVSTAIDPNAVASVTAIETKFLNRGVNGKYLPQRIAVVGQGASAVTYVTDKRQVLSEFEVGQVYGFGSPLHLAVKRLLPVNGDGVGSIPVTVYPLEDDVSGVPANGEIVPTPAETVATAYRVSVNNILSNQFVVSPGDTIADVVTAMTLATNAVFDMPIIATDSATKMGIAAKWAGESGNDLKVEVISASDTPGTTFAILGPSGGAVNPDVDVALNQFNNVWETLVLNCLNKSDTVTLNKFETFGEGRWLPLVKKPFVCFTGDVNATVNDATTISDARKADRVNAQLVSPGSNDLPFIVAARQLARIAVVAEFNPPTGYNGRVADSLTPGSVVWDYLERDEAIKKGSSTITIENEEMVLGDIATFYHPDGDEFPAYRFVVNIIKMQNMIYRLNNVFEAQEWRAAPLIPDTQATVNPNARQPKAARAEVAGILDKAGLDAIISDAAEAKTKTIAEINEANPDRLDITLTYRISGNTRIKAITQTFGYFTGGQQ